MCLSRVRGPQHQRLEPRVDDEGRDRIHELHLQQLDRRTLPRAAAATSCARADRPAAGPDRAGPPGTGRRCARPRPAGAPPGTSPRHASSPAAPPMRSPSVRSGRASRQTTRSPRSPSCVPTSRRDARRQPGERRRLARHHVRVEIRRPPHGLAGVVDDEVEPVRVGEQLAAERFDAGRVPQIEAEDLEAIAPLLEVRLLRVPRGRVARKPRRDDQLRAASQQLQAGLVADLHAPAGQQRDAAAESASSVRLLKFSSAHAGHS